ncbi:bifunctional precorrin-2 dehydrogenase/sirohydrochlorin ferrochelatase [Daejeonella sp.]|jgi:siroheme synthase-like protein|uniref:bifunctional precorrin-2 dehydrogenase/sirohydrochlorin ferrochelatase n=1 Tax=Daejeonella sp. TaxID=2805397 RepID=UPI0037BE8351
MNSQNKNNKVLENNTGNQLFPVFLKLNQLKVLLVGAGNIGLEKLEAVLSNSPDTQIDIVAESFLPKLIQLAGNYPRVKLHSKRFEATDLEGHDLVIIATGDNILNAEIRSLARPLHLLINVADKPDLCDFYLGSIVKKGDLKIGISTNGKSPTIAKRLKEIFQTNLPDELDLTLQQMNKLRTTLGGDFAHKVKELNKATESLINNSNEKPLARKISWKLLAAAFAGLILIVIMFKYY